MSVKTENTIPESTEQPTEPQAKERQHGYMEKRPPEVDDFSSPTTVYIRTNIERDEEAGCWFYDEEQITADEYRARRKAEYEQSNI